MKATDLRIGNIIYNTKGQVDVVNLDALKYIQDYERIHQASEVSLTGEWMHDFGFSSSFTTDPQERPASKKYEINNFTIYQVDEDKQEFVFFAEKHSIDVKYVHQLQNLYFALNGEELTCK